MIALWVALAFVGGMAFMWKVAAHLLYVALKRDLLFEQGLRRMDYEALLHLDTSVEREIAKRREPIEKGRL